MAIFKQFKKPTALIAASLAAVILLPISFFVFKIYLNKINNDQNRKQYHINSRYDTSDPFITKVLNLKDIIDGPLINEADPSLGNAKAPITIVYFADFECEFCQNQEKILKQIMNEYRDKIRLIWKDYPVNDPSAPSYQAAIAARCAGNQNKFWKYHNLLFEESHNLNKQTFIEIAQELELNLREFEKCLTSDKIKNLINDNIIEANALDIKGVPFIFVNKREIMGEIGLEELRKIIELELNKQN
jgi:predicted DsbA family dithiol-disulfide isomerase